MESQVWELSRLCPEPSTKLEKLYVHEFGFWIRPFVFGNNFLGIESRPITLFFIIATYFAMHKRTISLQASCPARVKSNKNIIYCCEEKDELPYFHLAFLLILENSQAYIYKTHTGYTITNCLHIYTTYTSTNSQQILHSIRCVIHII
jgi:hypothetical protein